MSKTEQTPVNDTTKPKQSAITMKDVARRVGVTPMTVSRVLNHTGRISPALRQTVWDAMREMNYQPNPHAQRLSTRRNEKKINLFSLYLDLGVGTEKLRSIQRLLRDKGFDAPLHAYGCYNEFHPVNQQALMSDLRQQRPRAIICNTGGLNSDAIQEMRQYQDEGGLVVCYDDLIDFEADQVVLDHDGIAYRVASYLLGLGHRRIGLYVPDPKTPSGPRLEGFKRALGDFGVSVREDWLFHGGDTPEAGGAQTAARVARMPERPTALFIVNDHAALSFVVTAQRAGMQVPRDISVVGQDDSPIAPYCPVPLTTMTNPVDIIAHNVVDLLFDRLEGRYDGTARRVVLLGELRERDSTAPPQSS